MQSLLRAASQWPNELLEVIADDLLHLICSKVSWC